MARLVPYSTRVRFSWHCALHGRTLQESSTVFHLGAPKFYECHTDRVSQSAGFFRHGSYSHNGRLRKRSTWNDGERLRFGFIGPSTGIGLCRPPGPHACASSLQEEIWSECSGCGSARDFGILCSRDSCPPARGERSRSEV